MIRKMSSEKFQEVRQKFAELYPDTNLTLLRNYSDGTLLITFDDLYVVDEDSGEEVCHGESFIDLELLIKQLEDLKKLL